MNLLKTYEHIINMCNYTVDDRGQVRYQINNKPTPVITRDNGEEKCIFLPLPANLRDEKLMGQIFFHPFVENLTRGESTVMHWIRKQFNYHYGQCLSRLLFGAVQISVDSSRHNELDNEQIQIISKMGTMDEKFLDAFKKILDNLAKRNSKSSPLILNLRRGGKIDGVSHSRVARWQAPLVEEIIRATEEAETSSLKPSIFGVPVRKQDLPVLSKITDVFFPNLDNTELWTAYSDGKDAPFAEAFLRAVYKVVSHTNAIALVLFGKGNIVDSEVDATNLAATYIDVDFIGKDFNVEKWRKECLLIPMQAGNEGKEMTTDSHTIGEQTLPVHTPAKLDSGNRWEDVQAPVQSHSTQVTPQAAQPVQTMAQQAASGARSYMDKLRGMNQPQYPQQMPQQGTVPMTAPNGMVYHMPMQMAQMGQMQQPMQHPAFMMNQMGQQMQNIPRDGFGQPLVPMNQMGQPINPNAPAPIQGATFIQAPQPLVIQPNGMVMVNNQWIYPQQAMAMGYQVMQPQQMNPMGQPMQQPVNTGSSFNFSREAFKQNPNMNQGSGVFNTSKY